MEGEPVIEGKSAVEEEICLSDVAINQDHRDG
jgi:hypothetical protein